MHAYTHTCTHIHYLPTISSVSLSLLSDAHTYPLLASHLFSFSFPILFYIFSSLAVCSILPALHPILHQLLVRLIVSRPVIVNKKNQGAPPPSVNRGQRPSSSRTGGTQRALPANTPTIHRRLVQFCNSAILHLSIFLSETFFFSPPDKPTRCLGLPSINQEVTIFSSLLLNLPILPPLFRRSRRLLSFPTFDGYQIPPPQPPQPPPLPPPHYCQHHRIIAHHIPEP
ncbi:hypothetical protein F4809DRAFT_278972 [Biscogniauxia mediterranea]|nr:hypothetical protein F4809DRAFT_278972 [Biscogniauxia mediterranea]